MVGLVVVVGVCGVGYGLLVELVLLLGIGGLYWLCGDFLFD